MFKTKLLILLLTNFLFISCAQHKVEKNSFKFKVGYIAGEFDGLVLKNMLNSYLNNQGMHDESSPYKIRADISHSSNLYITNIDNTADRERITSSISITIEDEISECQIYTYNYTISQFYIFASSDLFLSNQTAAKEIRKNNTEELVKRFFRKLKLINLNCNA